MQAIFMKAVLRALSQEIDIIFNDETGCSLQNNNYKDWVGNK